jgi:hypothetical protein
MELILLFLELSICYTLPNIIINRITELRVPNIVSMKENFLNNDTFNSSLANIKSVDYDEEEDMWVLDLDNSEEKEEYKFPSFEEFLKNKKAKDEEEVLKYFKQAEEKERRIRESYDNIEPTSKDLELLNNIATIEWAKNWIHDMVSYGDSFPKFMYQDMFLMRDFARENETKKYFYIGYFPSDTRLMHGPYYIGSFELIPELREFQTHLIIQNPNYMMEDVLDTHKIVHFKEELVKMTNDAMVFFKFSNLKNSSNERYYYSWLYEDN